MTDVEKIIAQLDALGTSQGEWDRRVTHDRSFFADAARVMRGLTHRPVPFDLMEKAGSVDETEGRMAPFFFARNNRANHECTEIDAARVASQIARGVL